MHQHTVNSYPRSTRTKSARTHGQVIPKSCRTQGQLVPKYNKMHEIHEREHYWTIRYDTMACI